MKTNSKIESRRRKDDNEEPKSVASKASKSVLLYRNHEKSIGKFNMGEKTYISNKTTFVQRGTQETIKNENSTKLTDRRNLNEPSDNEQVNEGPGLYSKETKDAKNKRVVLIKKTTSDKVDEKNIMNENIPSLYKSISVKKDDLCHVHIPQEIKQVISFVCILISFLSLLKKMKT